MHDRRVNIETPRIKSETGAFVDLFFKNLTASLATDPNAPSIDPKLTAFVEKVSGNRGCLGEGDAGDSRCKSERWSQSSRAATTHEGLRLPV
jgi:hypothetical protein